MNRLLECTNIFCAGGVFFVNLFALVGHSGYKGSWWQIGFALAWAVLRSSYLRYKNEA